jgi:uncharacterized protein YbjT (DUF2867 family)
VRVIVRDPAKLPDRVRGRVEVVAGSHADADVVDRAFEGADAVFWLVPPDDAAASIDEAYVGYTRPAADAFKRHGVDRVVGVSALGRGTAVAGRAGHVTASLAMDDLIAGTGVGYRALTMPSFMDNLIWQAVPIKTNGVFFGPLDADRAFPTCATRDIAATAARLLLDDSWSGFDEVPVLGPEDLSSNDMARIMSEVLGTPGALPADPVRGLHRQPDRAGDVPDDGPGHDRHDGRQERRARQRGGPHAAELHAHRLPPVVRGHPPAGRILLVHGRGSSSASPSDLCSLSNTIFVRKPS